MSQAKVDRYKQEKANRKKIMAREKVKRVLTRICLTAVRAVIVGWAGITVYQIYEEKKPSKTIYTDVSAAADYMNSLSTEE